MLSKKAALVFLATLALISVFVCGSLYIYDPLSVFHKPFARDFTIKVNNMRKQSIAIIRNFPFDSAIIGNSYTENTSSKEAGEMLGGQFINISMSGSGLFEQSFVVEYVLSRYKVKTVFRVLSEALGRNGHGSYPLSEWTFLYDDTILNDVRVYFNTHHLKCLAKWSDSQRCVGTKVDPDRPAAWFEQKWNASRFGGLDNWITYHDNPQLTNFMHSVLPENANKAPISSDEELAPENAAEIKSYIDEYVVQVAKKYPETNFIYFFNPHSLVQRAVEARSGDLKAHIFWVKEAVSMCEGLDNVQLYCFDNEPFTADIENYSDMTHYAIDINSLILQSINKGKNRLTPGNVDEYLNLLAKRAAAYDLKDLNEYVQKGVRLIKESEGEQK